MDTGAASSYIESVAPADSTGEATGRTLCLLVSGVRGSESGIQTFNRCLVQAASDLAERDPGLFVSTLCHNDDSREPSPYSLGATNDRIIHRGFRRSSVPLVWTAWRQARDVDVLITNPVSLSPAGWLMKLRNPRLRFYIVAYGAEVFQPLPVFQRLAAAAADGILTASEFARDALRGNHGWKEDRFFYFPNTIDPAFEVAARRRPPRPVGLPEGKVILTVCRLAESERHKGVDTLIRALPSILQREPAARLVVVGRGDGRARLEKLCRSLSVADSVQFAGFVPDEDLPGYYAHCDLFALPNRKDSFGIVFLEAMCFGKPCLAARVGGSSEAVGNSGRLVEADNVAALANAALDLLKKPPAPGVIRRQLAPYRYTEFRKRLAHLVYRQP